MSPAPGPIEDAPLQMIDPQSVVTQALEESASVKRAMVSMSGDIVAVATDLAVAFRTGRRLYACGNGGSACDAMHLVEELVARYRMERPGLPAHHLLDSPTLTCWANDYDFESAFARQVRTMGVAGDILVAISTSGNSPNVLRAAEAGFRCHHHYHCQRPQSPEVYLPGLHCTSGPRW